jgi:hypothetical protein
MRLPALVQSLRPTKPGHAFVLITAITILSLGVVGFLMVPSTPSYKVATWSLPVGADTVPKARALTVVGGLLGGRTNADGTACFWLGNDSDAVALMWPPRYSARGNPLTIFNEKGQAVATVGQFVNLDGSTTAPEDVLAKAVLGCSRMSSVILVAP